MSSKPLEIRRLSNGSSPAASSPAASALSGRHSRHASIARLGSPVPQRSQFGSPAMQQLSTPSQTAIDDESDLPDLDDQLPLPAPGHSALSSALAGGLRHSPKLGAGTPSRKSSNAGLGIQDRLPHSNYGSFDNRDMAGSPAPAHDPEIIRRHLVQFEQTGRSLRGSIRHVPADEEPGLDPDEFSSLQLQGGDVTREIYRWAEDADGSLRGRAKRSQSFHVSRPNPEDETLDKKNIMIPGGFRRNFLRRAADSPAPSSDGRKPGPPNGKGPQATKAPPQLFTNNFLEFLTLYGHFAGEDLEEDDEALEPDEYFSSAPWGTGIGDDEDEDDREPGEDSRLLTPGTPGRRRRRPKERAPTGTGSQMNAALLLLKSFVGTGVLFLPRAFMNGGMLFSSLLLLSVAALCFHCFILLVNTRQSLKVEASFGDLGGILYGKWFRALILFSIVISQVGFVAAYTVFTAENLQAFVLAVSKCKTFIDIKFMVLLQLIILLPVSLIRDIGKLGFTALIADAFILLGLVYLYYYDIFTIAERHSIADITLFNSSSWTLFIGTAIFTFEGVGLIIPIQESMRRPDRFPFVLGVVMVTITILFTSIGALSYAAYGSSTKTVVLLNMPQDSKMVNTVQFLYSFAIVLSTPLQLFPAIRIMENELFTRSGKYNPYIKWQKNVFRFVLVFICAFISWGGAADLDKFVSLVGSFACIPLVYIYPPILHLKAMAKTTWQRVLDYTVFGFGIVACAYTTVLTVQQWAGGGGDSSPGYCDAS